MPFSRSLKSRAFRAPSLLFALLAVVLSAIDCPVRAAQVANPLAPAATTTPAPAAPESPNDTLGRETPRGAVIGFIRAAQEENYTRAVQYFQPVTARHRLSPEQEQDLASQLLTVLNTKFPASSLDQLSRDPSGRLDDNLPPNQEEVRGSLGPGSPFVLSLIRVEDEHNVKRWYISRDALETVPETFSALQFPQLEKLIPKSLVDNRFLSLPLWQWLALLLFIPIALALARVISFLTYLFRRSLRNWRHREPLPKESFFAFGPGTALIAVLLHYEFVTRIGTSLLYRQYYSRVVLILLVIAFYWVVRRATFAVSYQVGTRLTTSGRMAERSLVSLARRVLDVVIFIVLALWVFSFFGYNVTTALAGLGIGGLAIGLGAQKTFENLLGGISILTDKALQVGDACRIGDQRGTVEDIGLRSTKLRTEDRTLVSVPNGIVASAILENFRLRDKILSRQTVKLRYDLAPDHVRYALEQIRALLAQEPKVEANTTRVRLIRFSDYSIDVEIYFYVLERDFNQFLALQEQIMLQVMETLDRTGASVALPSQTTIVNKDSWVDPEKAKAAELAIEKIRDPGVPGMKPVQP